MKKPHRSMIVTTRVGGVSMAIGQRRGPYRRSIEGPVVRQGFPGSVGFTWSGTLETEDGEDDARCLRRLGAHQVGDALTAMVMARRNKWTVVGRLGHVGQHIVYTVFVDDLDTLDSIVWQAFSGGLSLITPDTAFVDLTEAMRCDAASGLYAAAMLPEEQELMLRALQGITSTAALSAVA
jgi:hypothetical protein